LQTVTVTAFARQRNPEDNQDTVAPDGANSQFRCGICDCIARTGDPFR
jgi:hypothetical protein